MRCYHHFLQKKREEKNKNFKSEGPEPHPICWLLSDGSERSEVGSTPNGSQCFPVSWGFTS